MERREAGLGSPFALKSVETQPAGDPISPEARGALESLVRQVAAQLGVSQGDITRPEAQLCMLARDSHWTRGPRQDALQVEVALHNETEAPQFEGAPLTRLAPGEAVAYRGVRHRRRKGDWVRTLTLSVGDGGLA